MTSTYRIAYALVASAVAMAALMFAALPASSATRHEGHGGYAHHHRAHHAHVRHYRHVRHARRGSGGSSTSLGGLVSSELIAKTQEIVSACGSRVVSARAGRANRSNHPIGRAVDVVGNPSCIYSHLSGWPGGYSTDYGRVNHVHISYNPGGQEWGLRFAHGGGRHSHSRYARRHHRHHGHAQYASVGGELFTKHGVP